jgi:ribonuclease G
MLKKLVINVNDHETRVAFMEDGTLAELFVERRDHSDITGNIYKGRVQRVLPGMQAAFVDIGLKQAAFIYVNDILKNGFSAYSELFFSEAEEEEDGEAEEEDADGAATRRDIPIEELITENQEILVQVAKSPIGTKGARITSYISLPGRFLVLMPTSDHIGVSRRIEDEEERKRLKSILERLRSNRYGYIARTASEGVSAEKLESEMEFLTNLWSSIQEKYQRSGVPSLLHQELSLALRAVRDLLIHEADKLVIDSKDGYNAILSFLDTFMPSLRSSVECYEGQEPIFDVYNLEGDISRALKRKVWLRSGSYIVIEHTEALVAIDVNTGRYVGKHNLEETILKTNLEAVKEIAYQIRLRDIGGIIIIDFIDMEKKANQEKVFNALTEALKRDKSKTHVLPISELGLIQMTRKRVRKSFTRMMSEPCFYCEGEGRLLSRQTICHSIYQEVLREAQDPGEGSVTLHVNPEIAERLHGEANHLISSLEKRIGRQVMIYPNSKFHIEQFDILPNLATLRKPR